MQIVIDIDDNLYTRLFDNGDEYVADMRRACVAIRKGKPLPKGHGDLKDSKLLDTRLNFVLNHTGGYKNTPIGTGIVIAMAENLDAPTIIEADNTRDCNNCAYSDQGRCAGTEVCHECMWSNKFVEADKGE